MTSWDYMNILHKISVNATHPLIFLQILCILWVLCEFHITLTTALSAQILNFSWSTFCCILSEYRKIWTRKNSVFGHLSRIADYTKKSYLGCFESIYPHNCPCQVGIVHGKSQVHVKSKNEENVMGSSHA